jgi:hypothetical protein
MGFLSLQGAAELWAIYLLYAELHNPRNLRP